MKFPSSFFFFFSLRCSLEPLNMYLEDYRKMPYIFSRVSLGGEEIKTRQNFFFDKERERNCYWFCHLNISMNTWMKWSGLEKKLEQIICFTCCGNLCLICVKTRCFALVASAKMMQRNYFPERSDALEWVNLSLISVSINRRYCIEIKTKL